MRQARRQSVERTGLRRRGGGALRSEIKEEDRHSRSGGHSRSRVPPPRITQSSRLKPAAPSTPQDGKPQKPQLATGAICATGSGANKVPCRSPRTVASANQVMTMVVMANSTMAPVWAIP